MLLPLPEPSAVPAVVMLNPRAHHDLADLPAALAADLGPLLQRLERAVMAVPSTGRVHVNKWEVRSELDAWDGAVPAPDTISFAGGVQSLRFRKTQVIDLDLAPGTYALVCSVLEGQTRHWQEGMLEVVEVS